MQVRLSVHVIGVGAIVAGGILAASTPSISQEGGAPDAGVPYVLPQSGPFNPEDIAIENSQAITDWYRSAHADQAAEAFRHWDADEEIRPVCAVCHSGEGFRAFHGLDGSAPGIPDKPIPTGGVVDCGTCHNAGLSKVNEIAFPSGLMHPVEGVEAACLTCHQGRTAGVSVANAVAGKNDDQPDPELSFINPHYATAAATWLGGYAAAGFHYEGQTYSGRFFHARPVSTCNSCHDPHSLKVEFETCLTCHQGTEPSDIRISRQSYDGSGDTSVGIKRDIDNNAALLLDMVREYAADIAGVPLVYDGNRHPYFFADANGDAMADQAEGRPVVYNAWTPRMLRAAYNWKLVTADPGNFAHNPPYALELLYDAIADLAGPLGVDMERLNLLR
ncbi:cytochrome c3 family protein [Defluviimonas sp. WL0002]|uniref:Cytochrome c3 family protein n=1 Tax=Albidovulum marisflavi TaxID=2984159 RepID=A0ABT2ZC11_9RHOB|nr:cytochrome c3 family protein [Defluviimonas sp. WL0002]MCV2868680.1 cytochrome c3 family protein [Defluviimonas sp. WL0002]